MVLSPDYLKSQFASPEWAAAFADDPQGLKRKLVPVYSSGVPTFRTIELGCAYLSGGGRRERRSETAPRRYQLEACQTVPKALISGIFNWAIDKILSWASHRGWHEPSTICSEPEAVSDRS